MDELVNDGIVKYWRAGYVVISTSSDTGMERVLKVGCGCLRTPSFEGGLSELIQYLLAKPVVL
jgi:hypothetical protein